jgi:hypothetical protein
MRIRGSVNIAVMRAFVQLREMIASNKGLARRLNELEKKYDGQFRVVSKPFVNSWQNQRQNPAASDSRPDGNPLLLVSLVYLVSLVCLVYLACFVHLVNLLQPNKLDKQEKPSDSRATISDQCPYSLHRRFAYH